MPHWLDPLVLQNWLHSLGPIAWPVFLVLQMLQVVIFWIPGQAFEVVGGLVFGVWWGTFLSTVGLALGNLAAFLLARGLGKSWVDRWLARHDVPAWERLVRHPRLDLILAVLFFLPFLPKDAFCYLAGLSPLRPLRFLVVTSTARIPSLVLSAWLGDLAGQGRGAVLLGAMLVSLVLGAVVFAYRKSVLAFLVR